MWLEEVKRLLEASPVSRWPADRGLQPSAALVPLYVAAGELWVVLTRRASPREGGADLFAFPGGARQAGDEDEVGAALRVAREEIDLDPSVVVILGHLDDVCTPTGFTISPVVGAIPYPLAVRAASTEVEAVVPVPFRYLANPDAIEEQEIEVGGRTVASPVHHYRSHRLSGAAASIVADLVRRLTGGAAAPGR